MKPPVDILPLLCKIILLYQVFLLVEMSRPLAQEAELSSDNYNRISKDKRKFYSWNFKHIQVKKMDNM